ncbi:2-oxo-4-hydroxy-4-carboxy-5-ureidoimidazoline decarboxylase [Streptomyces lavendulocolor]|jgi:2-oxo-4-hydroxy-4-carboxy-5-ureidoimidazoline decarboxylase|uniref:2-oxo-4-hydroxy-4-carboxy-5-ureidoimidazoline decarboxylase n=1 Tax=Streptomyces lavendulocolor TaxID=67316 RepID=A0ABV2WD25_9ACTN
MAGDSTAGTPKRPPALAARAATPGSGTGTARPRHAPSESARARAIPAQGHAGHALEGLVRFNAAPAAAAEAALLACCGSRGWARLIAAHRPYPTLDALLAAADEASYDLSGADLDEALADEASAGLPPGTPTAAHTAWEAAHARYESRFHHAFVICLDGHRPEEQLNQALSAIHLRMSHPPEKERVIAADELRRLARARLSRLIGRTGPSGSPSVPV